MTTMDEQGRRGPACGELPVVSSLTVRQVSQPQ